MLSRANMWLLAIRIVFLLFVPVLLGGLPVCNPLMSFDHVIVFFRSPSFSTPSSPIFSRFGTVFQPWARVCLVLHPFFSPFTTLSSFSPSTTSFPSSAGEAGGSQNLHAHLNVTQNLWKREPAAVQEP